MKLVRFAGMIPLLIFLLMGGSISADILSENIIERDSQLIQQLLISVDSGSMTPNLNIGDLVVIENASKSTFNLSGDVILYQPLWSGERRAYHFTRHEIC